MRGPDDVGGRLRSFDPVNGAVDGGGGEQRRVLADGRQLQVAEPRELAVVVAEDGYVRRDLHSGCPEAFHDAEGRSVVEGDYG